MEDEKFLISKLIYLKLTLIMKQMKLIQEQDHMLDFGVERDTTGYLVCPLVRPLFQFEWFERPGSDVGTGLMFQAVAEVCREHGVL